jgi:hypothetical protein
MINLIKILCILIIWSIIILYIKKKELFLNTNVFSNNKIYVPWGESLQGCINNCIVSMVDNNKDNKDDKNKFNNNKQYCMETCTNANNCSKEDCKWLDDSIPSTTSNDNLTQNSNKDEYYDIQIIPFSDSVVINWRFVVLNNINISTKTDKFIIQLINRNNPGLGIKLYEKTINPLRISSITIDNLETDSEYNFSIYPILKDQISASLNPNNNNNNNNKNFMSQIYSFSTNSSIEDVNPIQV